MPPAGTSLMPAGLKNLARSFMSHATGSKRGREEEEQRDPIDDSDVDGDDALALADEDDSLTLATIDWNRYRPLAMPLDDDDREALENAGGAGGAPSGPAFRARVEFPGGARGRGGASPVLRAAAADGSGARGPRVVNGLPETAWRGGAEDDDDEDDDERTETERDDEDDDDAGEESEEERLRDERERAAAAARAASDAARAREAKRPKPLRVEGSEDGGDDLDFRLSEAGWPGATILGAIKRDGSTAVKVSWDDGEEKWIDSAVLHRRSHTLVTLVQFYESKAKNKG